MAEFDEMDMDHNKDPYDDIKKEKAMDEPNLIELKDTKSMHNIGKNE